jgi:type IV secretory pathway VirB6-like protein
MKISILTFGLMAVLGFQSCEKGKTPVKIPTPHPLLQLYFSHKPGTTWVYNIEGTNDTTTDYVNSDKGIYDIC